MKVTLKTLEQIEKMGPDGQMVTRGYYKSIFDLIADKNDWKGPIECKLNTHGLDSDLDVIRHAVVFFTGNPDCQVIEVSGWVLVKSAGYRAGPCG